MNQNDNNLLSFLKKQSLFNSPSKNQSRKRSSRSREKIQQPSQPLNYNTNMNQQFHTSTTNHNLNNNMSNNHSNNFISSNVQRQPLESNYDDSYGRKINKMPTQHNFTANDNYNKTYMPITNNPVNKNLADSRFKTFEEFEPRNHQERQLRNPEEKLDANMKGDIWAGLVSYSTSFESARVESAQCLENLGNRVRGQISNINYKIQNFNNRMLKVISNEFKTVKERIYHIIEQTFKESEKYIREYMKIQEDKLAGDILKMREVLMKEAGQIQSMREEINKPNWRKVAGEIIASELEQRIDTIVRQSSTLEVGRWELGDLVGYRLKDLERDLRDVVRLKRDRVETHRDRVETHAHS